MGIGTRIMCLYVSYIEKTHFGVFAVFLFFIIIYKKTNFDRKTKNTVFPNLTGRVCAKFQAFAMTSLGWASVDKQTNV